MKQLNTRVPDEAKEALERVNAVTGIKIEDIVHDALKVLAGEHDEMTKMRQKLVQSALRREHLSFSMAA